MAWDGRLTAYDFGAGHPMPPTRVELTIELARAFGLFAEAGGALELAAGAHGVPSQLAQRPAAGCRLVAVPTGTVRRPRTTAALAVACGVPW